MKLYNIYVYEVTGVKLQLYINQVSYKKINWFTNFCLIIGKQKTLENISSEFFYTIISRGIPQLQNLYFHLLRKKVPELTLPS